MDLAQAKVLGAVERDQHSPTQALKGTQRSRCLESLDKQPVKCCRRDAEHQTDVIVGRDRRYPEQCFAVRPAVPILQLSGGLVRRFFQMGRSHQADRLRVAYRLRPGTLQEIEVFLRHRRRDDLDHQPVLQPELDDVEEWLLPLHAAAKGLGTPALTRADTLDLVRLVRHR